MRIVVIGREFSDYDREVREWIREMEYRTGVEVERLDPDTADGDSFAKARDVVRYPSIIVETDDGRIVFEHSGTPFPSIDEAASFVL